MLTRLMIVSSTYERSQLSMKHMTFALLMALSFALLVCADEGRGPEQPVELGTVNWLRDLDSAVANSKKINKPIAILFQEVPG